MKRNIRLLAALCTMACAACSSDPTEPLPVRESPETTLRVVAEPGLGEPAGKTPQTRLSYTDHLGLRWQESDATKMGICYLSGGAWHSVASDRVTIGEDLRATFEAQVRSDATSAYFYYPAGAGDEGTKHTFVFAPQWTQARAGRADNFMVASPAVDLDPASWLALPQLKMVGAVLRFIIYSSAGSTERVQRVQLRANEEIASTEYRYDLATATAEPLGVRYKEVEVSLTEPYALDGITSAAAASGIYMPVRPATTTGYTYAVTTDRSTYEFNSSKVRTWADGHLYDVLLDLERGRHDLAYTWEHVRTSTEATTENTDLGYFFAYLDGATQHVPETSSVYDMLRFDYGGADWLLSEVGANNHLFVRCTGETTAKRQATVKVFFDGDSNIYRVADPNAPLFTFTVTQYPAVYTYALHYTWNDVKKEITTSTTDRIQLGWYFAYLDGSTERVPDSHEVIGMLRFEYADPADAGWLRTEFAGNNIFVTCTSAAVSQPRTATVHVVFNPDAPNAANYLPSDPEPLFTFTVRQMPVDYKYLAFNFDFAASNKREVAATAGTVTDAEVYWCSITAFGGDKAGRLGDTSGAYQNNLTVSSDAAWLGGGIVGNNHLVYSINEPNDTGKDRVGHLYGHLTAPAGYEDYNILEDPCFTVTVTQSGVHSLVANFEQWGGRFLTREIGPEAAADAYIQYVSYRLDGAAAALDGSSQEYTWIRFESDAPWLSGSNVQNTYRYTCTANTTGAPRTGSIRVYLDLPASVAARYAVVKQETDADASDTERLFTITITQRSQ